MRTVLLITFAFLVTSCSGMQPSFERIAKKSVIEHSGEVVLFSEVEWMPLNPSRGEKGPKAANLWGDRNDPGPSGFLVSFVDGFSSPPHIHNVAYRGVVIYGLIHNDDPDARKMWLPAGSFWTQPAGETHITSASGNINIAYIEIDNGPFLVLPTEQEFDDGERPVNVDKSNIVWLDASNTSWIDKSTITGASKKPELTFLWGNPQDDKLNGALLKLPAGFSGKIDSTSSILRAVIIEGKIQYTGAVNSGFTIMGPGSYFVSNGEAAHRVLCDSEEDCVIYVRLEGKLNILSNQSKE